MRDRLARWALRLFACVGLSMAASAPALTLLDTHLSPRNAERPRRRETRYIILHTTEGGSRGALQKLSRNGEAHYLVDEAGRIFRIVERNRVAFHCGLSMWEGRTGLDTVSIGIEVAGFHDRDPRPSQIASLKALLDDLKRHFRIPDERVLTHSMVAYGAPNRWHPRNHRGRKRCGMQFARWDMRRRLGLLSQPRYDPDVRAGRLVNADAGLAAILYGTAREQDRALRRYADHTDNVVSPGRTAWDIARDLYNHAETRYRFPDGTERRGSDITNWRALPPGTRVVTAGADGGGTPAPADAGLRVLGRDGDSPLQTVGTAWRHADTWYLYPDGRVVSGEALDEAGARSLPPGTRILSGYRQGGTVSRRRRAFDICGPLWNAAQTFYLFPDGSLVAGNRIDENRIPIGARIFYRE